MPVFDWTRTQLDKINEDGSTCLVYYQSQVDKVDPTKSDSDLTLSPGRKHRPGDYPGVRGGYRRGYRP